MRPQKIRTPGSVEDGLIMIMGALGMERAMKVVGKSQAHIYAWSDPDSDRKISLEHAMQLEAEYIEATNCGPAGPLTAMWNKSMALIAKGARQPKKQAEPLPDALLDITAGVGEVAAAIRHAIADHAICRIERDTILRSVASLRRELDDLEHATYAAHSATTQPKT